MKKISIFLKLLSFLLLSIPMLTLADQASSLTNVCNSDVRFSPPVLANKATILCSASPKLFSQKMVDWLRRMNLWIATATQTARLEQPPAMTQATNITRATKSCRQCTPRPLPTTPETEWVEPPPYVTKATKACRQCTPRRPSDPIS